MFPLPTFRAFELTPDSERLPLFLIPPRLMLLHASDYSNSFMVPLRLFTLIVSGRYVVEQLRCLGILQTCEVLKIGMPTRVTYAELKEVRGKQVVQSSRFIRNPFGSGSVFVCFIPL